MYHLFTKLCILFTFLLCKQHDHVYYLFESHTELVNANTVIMSHFFAELNCITRVMNVHGV